MRRTILHFTAHPQPTRTLGEVEIVTTHPTLLDTPSLEGLLAEADGILTEGNIELNDSRLRLAKRCLIIARAGPGAGGVDLESARAEGIMVTSIPDFACDAYAAAGLALIRSHLEKRADASELPARVGIVGLGCVGRRVAEGARDQELRVVACDPFAPEVAFELSRVPKFPLHDLLTLSDIVTLHLPRRTEAILGEAEIKRLPRDAFLINTSHPSLAASVAWVRALNEDAISGVATILTDEERRDPQIQKLTGSGKLKPLEFDFLAQDEYRTRTVERALEIIVQAFRGQMPQHLLIDPAMPRMLMT